MNAEGRHGHEDFLGDSSPSAPAFARSAPRPRAPGNRTFIVVAAFALTALIAGGIGFWVGRASAEPAAATPSVTAAAEPATRASPSPALALPSADPEPTAAPVASPQPSEPADPEPEDALRELFALLDGLEVKGRAPMTGYDRDLFGEPWEDVDENGCDTRNDILQRDLTDLSIRSGTDGCIVESGVLDDPYLGTTTEFERGWDTSGLVQIDHVVPLGDAWAKGAQSWNERTRLEFANDPLNLLAVDGQANQQKGAGDAATWLPPNRDYWCEYAARIVLVKSKYEVWTTSAEHARLGDLLTDCEGDPGVTV